MKLADRIKNARLTQTEKRIADYFLEHGQSLYFSTSKSIALELGVSDTSVIRLCRSLGYRGFRDLQESMREELSQAMARERYVIPQNQVKDKFSKYQDMSPYQYLEMTVENLQNTYNKNEAEKFASAAELILGSEHVYVAGFRGSASIASHLGVLLSQLVRHVRCSAQADSACVEAMLDYGVRDCVILVGAERYSKMTKVLAGMARAAGCRLIVITDKITADIASGANIVFVADFSSPSPFHSFIGAMYIAETIAFEVSKSLGVETRRRLARLNDSLEELQLY